MIPAKVQSGDPFRYPAEFFNLQVDMAAAWQRGQFRRGTEPPEFRGVTQGQWCYVKNDSGQDCSQFAALKITGIVFSPSDREIEFRTNFAFTVGTTGDDTQPIVVLLEPIKNGKIGRALIDGMVPAKVQINDSTQRYAILDGSSVGRLKTDAALGVELIYTEDTSGEQWAIVRVGRQHVGYKPFIHFTLSGDLDETDASQSGTIVGQMGVGLSNPNTGSGAVTLHNVQSSPGGYLYSAASGTHGLALWRDGNNYIIMALPCPN